MSNPTLLEHNIHASGLSWWQRLNKAHTVPLEFEYDSKCKSFGRTMHLVSTTPAKLFKVQTATDKYYHFQEFKPLIKASDWFQPIQCVNLRKCLLLNAIASMTPWFSRYLSLYSDHHRIQMLENCTLNSLLLNLQLPSYWLHWIVSIRFPLSWRCIQCGTVHFALANWFDWLHISGWWCLQSKWQWLFVFFSSKQLQANSWLRFGSRIVWCYWG